MTSGRYVGVAAILLSGVFLDSVLHFGQTEAEVNGQPMQAVTISGFVYDSGGKAIGGVDVTAWVLGNHGSVNGAKTNMKTGEYKFAVNGGGPFDVSYKKSNYRTSWVRFLADRPDHRISKFMYKRGEPMPVAAMHDYFQTINRISFFALALQPGEQREQFMSHFPDEPADIKEVGPIPKEKQIHRDASAVLQLERSAAMEYLDKARKKN